MPTILQSVAMTVISGTTATRTFASACTPGSRIVAMATQENHSGTFAISDPTNGAYAADSNGANAVAGNGTAATVRSVANSASTALTVTVTLGASGSGTFVVYEISASTLDAASSGLGGVGSPTPTAHTGSISAAANASVFSIGGHYPSGAVVDSGYTSAFAETGISISYHFGEYDEDAGAAGTKTLTYGLGSIENWSLAIASYVTSGGSSPTVSSTSTATPANGASLTITGTNFGATQGAGSVTIGGITQTVTSWADTSITVTVARGTNKYGVGVNVVVTDNSLVSSSPYALTSIQPQSGWAFVNLTTPNTAAANRLQTSPDLASGDQIAYDTVSSGVTVATDATFTAANTVTRFQFEAWTTGGWGALGEQILYPQWFAPASADSYELAAKVAQFQALLNPQTWFGPIAVEKWFADELSATAGAITGDVNETATAADAQTAVLAATAARAEPATASDAPTATAVYLVAGNEAATAADAPSATVITAAAASESSAATDTPSAVATFVVARIEAASATDTTDATASGALSGSVTEAAAATDAQTAVLAATAARAEPATASDTPAATAQYPVAISEAASASDSLNGINLGGLATVTEAATAGSAQSAIAAFLSAMLEPAAADAVGAATAARIAAQLEAATAIDMPDATGGTSTDNRIFVTMSEALIVQQLIGDAAIASLRISDQ